jgi:hypothetical protein
MEHQYYVVVSFRKVFLQNKIVYFRGIYYLIQPHQDYGEDDMGGCTMRVRSGVVFCWLCGERKLRVVVGDETGEKSSWVPPVVTSDTEELR